jgi:hypothetical protein
LQHNIFVTKKRQNKENLKMKLNVTRIDENRRIVVGTVTKVDLRDNVANVTIEGNVWNAEEKKEEKSSLTIAFFNNDTVKMRDRIEKAKVEAGKVISATIYEKDGKVYGNNFKYSGVYDYLDDRNNHIYVIHGVVCNPTTMTTESGKKLTRVSMPMERKSKDEETEWATITFWNTDKANTADSAEKIFTNTANPDEHKKAIVVCGQESDYEGRRQFVGYRFEVI